MGEWAVFLAIGLSVAFVLEGGYLLLAQDGRRARKVKARLDALNDNPHYTREERRVVKERLLSDVPAIHRLLLGLPGVDLLALNLERAGLATRAATIVAWSGGLLVLTGLIVSAAGAPLAALPASVTAALFPIAYVWGRKVQRVSAFSKQLPEGVDLLVRSLKAGHSLSSGFRLIADELSDPLAREFAYVYEELNLGRDFEEALENLRERIDTPDVRLLCTSVLIQRETGGNLVEILENIADMIRKRTVFQDKLGSLTAEGRLSGMILMGLPPTMIAVLMVLNRPYAQMLFEPGPLRWVLAIAAILQVLGGLWIRSIVTVRY